MWISTNFSQALLFLLVLAGSTILCGRLCYCLSFSLSKVQCYLCKNKVPFPVNTTIYYIYTYSSGLGPCLSFKWIYKYTYPSLSIKEPLIFVVFVRCISFSIKYIQRPRDQGYEYLHLLNIFLFLDFPARVGVWEAQKALFTEVKIRGNKKLN